MSESTIVGKLFGARVIDRVTDLGNSLIEIGFTDHTFERVHANDFESFCDGLAEITEATEITEVETSKFEMLAEVPYTDEEGNELGKTEIGSIQEVPTDLGESWVEQGLAKAVSNTEVTE